MLRPPDLWPRVHVLSPPHVWSTLKLHECISTTCKVYHSPVNQLCNLLTHDNPPYRTLPTWESNNPFLPNAPHHLSVHFYQTLDILENFPDCGTLNIPCIFQRFYTKSYVIYPKHILDNFPDCETLNIPCIFQRFYTKSYIMYSKHILGIFQIVEYKILITYSFLEIHQKILNIQELPETRRF